MPVVEHKFPRSILRKHTTPCFTYTSVILKLLQFPGRSENLKSLTPSNTRQTSRDEQLQTASLNEPSFGNENNDTRATVISCQGCVKIISQSCKIRTRCFLCRKCKTAQRARLAQAKSLTLRLLYPSTRLPAL